MVNMKDRDNMKSLNSKDSSEKGLRARKINASTDFETCSEQLSPFGGLLGLIKFFDLTDFKEVFEHHYIKPSREPRLGNYRMLMGILMLLFIGFNRLWHFTYIRLDAMICGFFQLTRLPVASTFWRYVDNLGINQAKSLLNIMSVLRERVWLLCGLEYKKIHLSIDTTIETLYGNQQGGRKGYNPQNRGKKTYRPVVCFIDETKEYMTGKLRKGVTMGGEEVAKFIKDIKNRIPGCVEKVLIRGDGEFFSWESVQACIKADFEYIIAHKKSRPPFDPETWYRPKKRKPFEYNGCTYKPIGWEIPCRFVAMRIPKELKVQPDEPIQYELFEDDRYTYRIFCTSLMAKPHKVIAKYDKRADVENLVGEAKREGLDAIPSGKFKNNYAFFQIVMLAYNIWRYYKMLAEISVKNNDSDSPPLSHNALAGLTNNHIRIARLKLLLIAAKVVYHSKDKVKYSTHDSRTPVIISFLKFLDEARSKVRPWVEGSLWQCRFSFDHS
jgi:hypothetical protein